MGIISARMAAPGLRVCVLLMALVALEAALFSDEMTHVMSTGAGADVGESAMPDLSQPHTHSDSSIRAPQQTATSSAPVVDLLAGRPSDDAEPSTPVLDVAAGDQPDDVAVGPQPFAAMAVSAPHAHLLKKALQAENKINDSVGKLLSAAFE